jgi:uncharacterized membrane protein YdbT with pleckstrin-like domain
LLVQLPLQLFFTLWAGAFFGGLLSSLDLFPRVFGIPAVAYFGKKLNYSRTEYPFLLDHLEFEEGFFSINKKAIRSHDVREVTLHKGVFQRIYGLGTIYLATLATGSSQNFNPFVALGFGNVSASGVSVRDVRDPDQVFEQIRRLVDANKE